MFSIDSIIKETEAQEDYEEFAPIEFVNNRNPSGMPQHKLSLKINCQVMLLRNMFVNLAVVNGKRMIVRNIGLHMYFLNKKNSTFNY